MPAVFGSPSPIPLSRCMPRRRRRQVPRSGRYSMARRSSHHLTLAAQADGREMSWSLARSGEVIGLGCGARRRERRRHRRATVRRHRDADEGWREPAGPVRRDWRGPDAGPFRSSAAAAPAALAAGGVATLRVRLLASPRIASLALWRATTSSRFLPTRLVGRPGRCPCGLLDSMVRYGNSVAQAHSRFHGTEPATFADFYLETSASRDLRAMGLTRRCSCSRAAGGGGRHFSIPRRSSRRRMARSFGGSHRAVRGLPDAGAVGCASVRRAAS